MATFSIILATFNSEKFIHECIQSILSQVFTDFELLIVDDGSTDGTPRYLEELAKSDQRIQVYRNVKNRGMGYNYRFLLEKCSGELIAQIGHDDCWHQNYLLEAAKCLKNRPNFVASVAKTRLINDQGTVIENKLFLHDQIESNNQQKLVLQLYQGNFICASAVVFQKKFLVDSLPLVDLDQFQDWMTWLVLALKGPFYFGSEQLVSYRVHQNNLSLSGRSRALSRLECNWLRPLFLKSKELSQFVLAQPDPDAFLFSLFAQVDKSINVDRVEEVTAVFQSIKEQEVSLGELPSYRATMGMFYWYFGALKKSSLYFTDGQTSNSWVNLLSSLNWKTLLVFKKEATAEIPRFFIKFKNIGPCFWVQIRLRNEPLPIIPFTLVRNTRHSYLESLERFIAGQQYFNFARIVKFFKGKFKKCLIPNGLRSYPKKTTDLELGSC